MIQGRIAGSFRDPSGFVFRRNGVVYRCVSRTYAAIYDRLVESGFYRSAIGAGELVPHEEVQIENLPDTQDCYKVLRPEQIAFISYPYEWCVDQLKQGALLTLALQKRALAHGFSLKDASAYNVQFHNGRPIFIDTLSFDRFTEGQPWAAYNQFCRHFLAPLALATYTHVDLLKTLRVNVDGIPIDLASALLPFRTKVNFGLQVHVHMHARSLTAHADTSSGSRRGSVRRLSRVALQGLIDSLERTVKKLEPRPSSTAWGNYYEDTNYSDAGFEHKRALVTKFITEIAPESVWDLGANDGAFSRLASDTGIATIAIDGDPVAVKKTRSPFGSGRRLTSYRCWST